MVSDHINSTFVLKLLVVPISLHIATQLKRIIMSAERRLECFTHEKGFKMEY